jgi:hypothetical protein
MEIKSSTIWDILSVLVLAATAGVLVLYGVIFFFPNNPLNVFPPEAPPAVVVLPSPTNTLAKLPPTNTLPADALATATIRPSETLTATITATEPTVTPSRTFTPSLSPTITGTPPTATRTPTNTQNPIVLTNAARTAIAKTNTAAVALTNQAKTNAVLQQTQNVRNTQTAQARTAAAQTEIAGRQTQTAQVLTQTAQVLTQTQSFNQTATAQVMTATQNAHNTATAQSVTQTQIATVTLVARVTQTVQAQIVSDNPIAYSITGGDETAEWFISRNMSGTVNYTLNMSGYPQARPATGWWLGEVNNHFLLFSDPSKINPVHRILYTTGVTVEQISTGGISANLLEPSVNLQEGIAENRVVVFALATGGFGTDRNLWIVNGAGGEVTQISDDPTWDDHDPSWTTSGSPQIIYVTGSTLGAENVYRMSAALSSYPGTRLTFYDVSTTEINSPRWCSGYDWDTEVFFDRIVFAMRTSPSDDWDLYAIDPSVQAANGNNEGVVRLTNTAGVDELQPDWSPFCSRITYLSNSGGQWDIWTMARDGSDSQKMTDNADVEARPLWMPYK